ncbi:sugar phosphate nucleotidyltransferase [Planobispora takensis]|uniref:Glucose-1-phosphate thymidylyltransferase n=1 Tax=Planobispora takensis TaxID=1367882 RepID=A0A8J3WUC5_9ACTN|nr:sugar phosphate nucleotidyltransferase [Planobispora takensis]GII02784.1 glucose-1-phosphate thymidylyltransferase [Planobispora takensis]
MKALILAGHVGTRPRPHGHAVPVANRPVLSYGLESIRKAGVCETAIVVSAGSGAAVRKHVGTGAAFGLDVTYLQQDDAGFSSGPASGLGGCVLVARDYLGDDDFLVLRADDVVLDDLPGLVAEFARRGRPDAMAMVGDVTRGGERPIAVVDGHDRVTGVTRGPGHPSSGRALIGPYVFGPAVHQAVLSARPDWRGARELSGAVSWLITHGGTVLAHSAQGYWNTAGCVDDVLDCNREVLSRLDPLVLGDVDDDSELLGRVFVDAGASVRGSRVIGPAVVGVGATVTASVIGPHTSLGPDCEVDSSMVEHSIVLEGASLLGVGPLRNSLIGRNARVVAEPAGARLVLADHSQVLLPADVMS